MSTDDTVQALSPMSFPLWGGRLIEASAGTGKTWTMAALYVRLVLGHGGEAAYPQALRPDQILVMTFTRAATRELSDRIRARLVQAAQAFRGSLAAKDEDSFLTALKTEWPEAQWPQAAWRLEQAATSMDDAAIHTIDAWCQRMLREHALDSGSLFDETLQPEEQALRQQALQDVWRQQAYPLSPAQMTALASVWPSLDAMAADLKDLLPHTLPDSPHAHLAQALDDVGGERLRRVQAARQGWPERVTAMRAWFEVQLPTKHWSGNKLKPETVAKRLAVLDTWARNDTAEAPDFKAMSTDKGVCYFMPDALETCRNKNAPDTPIPPVFDDFAQLRADLADLPELAPALRCVATHAVQRRLRALQQARRELSFGEVQERLAKALLGPQGARLRERIVEQTPVALIDEFQDTSALQYQIFDALFRTEANDPATALLLIGDPKQSIYRFRGADIASYLQARRATKGRHYRLGTNFRSSTAVVQAVNALFEHAETREANRGAFAYREPDGRNPLPFAPVLAQGRPERWVVGGLDQAALTVCWEGELLNGDAYRERMAALAAERICTWLMDDSAGFDSEKGFVRLRPADVAVLVPGRREAQAMRRALQARALPSVYLSDRESVFDSQEALDLLRWLQAVAQPGDIGLVRAAWASSTWALSLDELQRMAQDDALLDERCELMRSLQNVWRSQGVLPMWRQTLHRLGLPQRWLGQESAGPPQAFLRPPGGSGQAQPGPRGPALGGERRLSNVLHLAELMQQASQDALAVPGEAGLIRWLTQHVLDARAQRGQAEDQIVRLESDADLVKIVTIHQSKGLEYPLVLMPFAGHFRPLKKAAVKAVQRVQPDSAEKRWDLNPSDEAKAEEDHERLREELRLLYVGLTRARHALWLGFAPLRHQNSKLPQSHRSALGRLLVGPGEVDVRALEAAVDDWPGRRTLGPALRIEPAQDPAPPTRWEAAEAPPALAPARPYAGGFDTRWGVASFSSLVRAMSAHSSTLTPLPRQAAEDEALAEAPDAPSAQAPAPSAVAPWHRFERGALAGNFLHEQLEWLATQHFAWGPGTEAALRQRFDRAGRSAQADDGVAWLQALLAAPLCDAQAQGPGVPAPGLQRVMAEMEFWLPAAQLDAPEVHWLCQTQLWPELPRPALPQRQLHGLVMGFADLVVEHEGRFWVLDYKSNHLGSQDAAYTPERMAQAFVEARYDVQAVLYLLALHRLLRSRLGAAYQPEHHLGGALYWFIRGVAAPSHGVLTVPTPWPLLQALDAMLEGASC